MALHDDCYICDFQDNLSYYEVDRQQQNLFSIINPSKILAYYEKLYLVKYGNQIKYQLFNRKDFFFNEN